MRMRPAGPLCCRGVPLLGLGLAWRRRYPDAEREGALSSFLVPDGHWVPRIERKGMTTGDR